MTAGEIARAQPEGHGEPAARPEGQSASLPEQSGSSRRWPDEQALAGPFTTRQLVRLDQALRTADDSTGLAFSIYVGELTEPTREHAQKLHAQLARPAESVLIAVSPNQRVLEIVTGAQVRRRLPDRDCKLAALTMTAAFAGGDLAGGIAAGLAQLADRARA